MKFQLFGRLRDDNSGDNSPPERNRGQEPGGLGGESSPALGGGSLERTVENMFSQGYSEEEIKQELQGQYPREKINQAVNNAVASTATTQDSSGPEPMSTYQGGQDAVSPVDQGYSSEPQAPENDNMTERQPSSNNIPNSPPPQPQGQQEGSNPETGGVPSSNVEELVETIVAENFDRVERELENIYEEIDEIKDELGDMEQRVHDLEVRDDEDQQEFIQKMDEIEEHIDSYQSRIGGLEKAFQQVLPSLVNNVRDLTELVQEIKQERGIETDKNVSSKEIEDLDMEDWD